MIGANVALHLEQLGHEVHALDHFAVGRQENLRGFKGVVHKGDIRTFDYDTVGRVDAVFHQAAITDTTVMDENLMLSVNVEAFKKILDYAVREGLILENPALVIDRKKLPKPRVLIPSKSDFEKLFRISARSS